MLTCLACTHFCRAELFLTSALFSFDNCKLTYSCTRTCTVQQVCNRFAAYTTVEYYEGKDFQHRFFRLLVSCRRAMFTYGKEMQKVVFAECYQNRLNRDHRRRIWTYIRQLTCVLSNMSYRYSHFLHIYEEDVLPLCL